MSEDDQEDKRIGNEFWKARSKHGRDKIFGDSQTMLEAAYEYFQWNQENAWHKNEAIKSGDRCGDLIEVPTERPLTIYGLTQFWGVSKNYLEQFEKALPEGEKDFSGVIEFIRDVIYRQKFEGAVVGAFNANIISRELGLADRSEHTGKDGSPLLPALTIQPMQTSTSDILEKEPGDDA